MKIHILSDVHLEFGKFRHTPPECDVAILAGDIGVGKQGAAWAKQTFGDTPVVYVPGNHEFYGRALDMDFSAYPFVLQNQVTVIGGVKFIGATLWTDFNLFGAAPLDSMCVVNGMSDFRVIEGMAKDRWLEIHLASRDFIEQELATAEGVPCVVVTHHAPSGLSVHERYGNDPFSAGYASRLESLMLNYAPLLWVHGHMHDSFDYHVGATRVVTNPRGYIGVKTNRSFDPALVLEIETGATS